MTNIIFKIKQGMFHGLAHTQRMKNLRPFPYASSAIDATRLHRIVVFGLASKNQPNRIRIHDENNAFFLLHPILHDTRVYIRWNPWLRICNRSIRFVFNIPHKHQLKTDLITDCTSLILYPPRIYAPKLTFRAIVSLREGLASRNTWNRTPKT